MHNGCPVLVIRKQHVGTRLNLSWVPLTVSKILLRWSTDRRIVPVSYTHLDVYKRQTLYYPFRNETVDILDRNRFVEIYDTNESAILTKRREYESNKY